MIRRLLPAATLALAAALAGCSSGSEPAAAPGSSATTATPASAAPSPTTDDKRGCHALSTAKRDATAARDAGALAGEASDPAIRQAGIGLINAANDVLGDQTTETMLALDRARLALADACADKYGDGPW
ncbi:hypothetical protein ACFYUR_22160 [Micromonospora haikouensis]|uniref:hypothetical protein n=1 Tax=Micromonospora haikouensis TaxID=686309 RepID=UPI0036A79156